MCSTITLPLATFVHGQAWKPSYIQANNTLSSSLLLAPEIWNATFISKWRPHDSPRACSLRYNCQLLLSQFPFISTDLQFSHGNEVYHGKSCNQSLQSDAIHRVLSFYPSFQVQINKAGSFWAFCKPDGPKWPSVQEKKDKIRRKEKRPLVTSNICISVIGIQ